MSPLVDESVLDDPKGLALGDPAGMLRAVASAGAQVRDSARRTAETDLAVVLGDGRPRALIVAGMGGSGMAGEVLVAVAGSACPVPVVVVRGYRLPGWVGPMDLVVAVSCSGATAETLSVTDEAVRRGCRVVTVGRPGSPLSERAGGGRVPHVPVDPSGRAPRSNLWALSVPLLVLADALGVLSCPAEVLESVADRLDRDSAACGPGVETYDNPAKRLALDLAGKLPLVWGSTDLAGAAAYRLACQLAENAKYPSVAGTLPEAHHNQVVAFAGAFGAAATDRHDTGDDIFRDRVEDAADWPRLRLVLLRDTDELPELARRREATIRLAEEHGVGVQEVAASGEHPLERLASLVGPTDLASVYLALALGMDPTPVEPITTLKERTRT